MGGGILMKYLKVVLEVLFEAPEDTKIVTYSDEDMVCLKINGQEYTPFPEWLKRGDDQNWVSASEDEDFDQFIGQPGKIDVSIQAISEKEFREAMPQQ
jgi:hypothetical protein